MSPTLRRKESSSDIVQSVCREVLHRVDRFRDNGDEGFRAWLFETAIRKILNRDDYYHAQKRDVEREHRDVAAPAAEEEYHLDVHGSACTPSRIAIAREEAERLERAFDRLPADYRAVIRLARVAGLPRREVARTMGRSESAVASLLYRALADLAVELSG